ncbi:MAG: RluA family pseudouridine synthase [Lachnospiraceae bacterium]|nr:RluA family pseudouridine synthase [Lachnospiraceae bacterium]
MLMNKEQILYEDKDIIVCHKPAGIATQTARIGQRDMVSEVSNYLGAPVKLVHRLDQPVEGILVFAKSQKAAGELGRQITSNQMEKYYYAVVAVNSEVNVPVLDEADSVQNKVGKIEFIEGKNEITLINYLYKDNKTNTSAVVTKDKNGAKRAELRYTLLDRSSVRNFVSESLIDFKDIDIALARIELLTGRHHQIRVQMSHAGMSLLGDYKYADERTKNLSELLGQKNVALCAYKLTFNHPITGKRMSFQKEPESEIFQNFSL